MGERGLEGRERTGLVEGNMGRVREGRGKEKEEKETWMGKEGGNGRVHLIVTSNSLKGKMWTRERGRNESRKGGEERKGGLEGEMK